MRLQLSGSARFRRKKRSAAVPRFFAQMAQYLCKMDQIRSRIAEGYLKTASEEELAVFNREPYEDVIGERYETSYGNPAFAVRALGETHGRSLCCLYRELGNAVVWVYEDRLLELTAVMELYLELYAMFEEETLPSAQYVKESIYWYVSDYAEERQEYQVREIVDPSLHFVKDIVMESDLTDLRYLYQYGEYITENEKGTARFLNTFSQEEIDAMARTYTEGFRKCFLVARKDLSKKKTVSIRFHIGFERMIRAAILQFREMGLEPVISRGARRTWVAGASANKQYDYDHRNDEALYLNEDLVKRRLRAMQVKYDEYKELADGYAGPAVVETFGEVPFEPVNKKQALHLNERQQKLRVGFQNEAGQIVNRYIKDDEYGYTIIAYPMPEIDPRYEKIFREIVKINTLDYEKIPAHPAVPDRCARRGCFRACAWKRREQNGSARDAASSERSCERDEFRELCCRLQYSGRRGLYFPESYRHDRRAPCDGSLPERAVLPRSLPDAD